MLIRNKNEILYKKYISYSFIYFNEKTKTVYYT